MTSNFLVYWLMFTTVIPCFRKDMSSVMYLNIENTIYIDNKGNDPEEIQVKASPGSVYKKDDSTYTFVPLAESEELKIKLYFKKVLCEVKTVAVRKIPDLIPVMEGETDGYIKLSDLQKSSKIYFKFPADYPQEMKPVIVSYNMFATGPNGNTLYSGTLRSEKFDDYALSVLSKLPKGAKLVLNNIITQNPRTGHSRLNINKEIWVTD